MKVRFLHKISFKMVLIVAVSSLLTAVLSLLIIVPNSMSQIEELTKNEMLSIATAYTAELDYRTNTQQVLSYESLNLALKDVQVSGMESSYAYLVNAEGKMLYHPTKEKVGKEVENSVVKGLVKQLESGEKPETSVVEYEYKGATKYASYGILSNNNILVVSADKTDALAASNYMLMLGISADVLVFFVCVIFALFAVRLIVNPLLKLTGVIRETSNLDFTDDIIVTKVANRSDEIGVMGKAIKNMREQLKDMVVQIQSSSQKIYKDVTSVNDISVKIREQCMDNSATSEQLAAGVQETSATSGTIADNIDEMKNGAADIEKLSVDGVALSEEISERATSLQESANEAVERVSDMYETIKNEVAKAVEAAECVKEINAMTDSIMQISSQTSLLALNASIEAARAGEAGKGFAVVASEISKLANETSDSVTSINEIVSRVNASVDGMVHSMEDTTKFMDEVVLKDYDQFKVLGDQYNNDSEVVKSCMENVEAQVVTLTNAIQTIAEAITGINETIDEAAIGVSDIAAKTGDVVNRTAENVTLVDACMQSVEELETVAKKFTL